jgi:hypothetical protein
LQHKFSHCRTSAPFPHITNPYHTLFSVSIKQLYEASKCRRWSRTASAQFKFMTQIGAPRNRKLNTLLNGGRKLRLMLCSTAWIGAAHPPLMLQITDEFIAQICPADLANHVCAFDYVMPNGCDHNCEMLRLCEVSIK